jgi:uncharacterized protein YbaP (TraB family)
MKIVHRSAALAVVALLAACSTAPQVRPTSAGRSFLWEARKGGGEPIWLLGSIHVGQGGGLSFSESIEGAWRQAEGLVVEVDTTKLDPGKSQALLMSRATLPPGQELPSRLPAETYQGLAAAMQRLGMPIAAFASYKPWFVAMLLESAKLRAQGYGSSSGIDERFLGKAKAENRPVYELESADEQLGIFDEFSDEVQAAFVDDAVRNVDTDKLGAIELAWRDGDVEELERILLDQAHDEQMKPVYERLLFSRNERMAERIEELRREGKRLLVVVGAGHFVGERGLLRLLSDKGYTLNQL